MNTLPSPLLSAPPASSPKTHSIARLGLLLSVLLTAVSALASPQPVVTTNFWTDTSSKIFTNQCGSLLKVNGTFYWYGYNIDTSDVACYTSADLVHWTFATTSCSFSSWHGRPRVVYNDSTSEYVMITEGPGSPRNGLAYFTAKYPTNTFKYIRSDSSVFGKGLGDHGLFQDTDGRAYLLATTDDINGVANGTLTIVQLSADYLSLSNTVIKFNQNSDKREASCILKRGSTYYYFTSACNNWDSSATKYMTSTSLGSGWSAWQTVGTAPSSSDSFNTQNNQIYALSGTSGTSYIYMGDRWCQRTGVGKGLYGWYPLTFDGQGVPTMHGYNQWTIDAATGMWASWYNNGGLLPDGPHKIVSKSSGLVVDAVGQATGNGTPIDQWSSNGGDNQKWNFFHLGGNQYEIQGVQSGRVLDIGSSGADGTQLYLYDWSGAASQKWTATNVSGYFGFINGNSGNLGMNVHGSYTTNGTPIEVWGYAQWPSQLWSVPAP